MRRDPAPGVSQAARIGGGAVAAVVLAAGTLLACTRVTEGQGAAPSESITQYRADVTASLSTSRSKESERQSSSSSRAMADACTTFAAVSNAAVEAGNDLISTMNQEGGYGSSAEQKVGPVVNALNTSAGQIDNASNQAQTNELRDALDAYAQQSRKLAVALENRKVGDGLNAVVHTFNDAREHARDVCLPFLEKKGR